MLPGVLKNLKAVTPILSAIKIQDEDQEIGEEYDGEAIEEEIANVYNMSDCEEKK